MWLVLCHRGYSAHPWVVLLLYVIYAHTLGYITMAKLVLREIEGERQVLMRERKRKSKERERESGPNSVQLLIFYLSPKRATRFFKL